MEVDRCSVLVAIQDAAAKNNTLLGPNRMGYKKGFRAADRMTSDLVKNNLQ